MKCPYCCEVAVSYTHLVVLVFFAVFGVKMDVEFKGGSMITLAYEGDVDLNDLRCV